MDANYYSVHPNKKRRKLVKLGNFMSPEQKRNLVLKMYEQLPDQSKVISEMFVITRGFRKDKLTDLLQKR